MLRRIAITLVGITAAGFMAAAPAAATDVDYEGGSSYAGLHADHKGLNIGGHNGITYFESTVFGFEGEHGYHGRHHDDKNHGDKDYDDRCDD